MVGQQRREHCWIVWVSPAVSLAGEHVRIAPTVVDRHQRRLVDIQDSVVHSKAVSMICLAQDVLKVQACDCLLAQRLQAHQRCIQNRMKTEF